MPLMRRPIPSVFSTTCSIYITSYNTCRKNSSRNTTKVLTIFKLSTSFFARTISTKRKIT